MKPDALHIPIRVAGLADGIHEFTLEADPGRIGLPAEFRSPVHLDVHMDKSHAHIVLALAATAVAVYACDRCLDEIEIPLRESVTLVYAKDAAAEHMKDDENVRTLAADDTFIDAGDDVRDVLLLAIPMRRVCADYRDNPACGAAIPAADSLQADIDPRWEALRALAADEPAADGNGSSDGDGSTRDEL